MSRLERLHKLLKKDTHNAFALYGLAMEYRSQGDLKQATLYFQTLLEEHPDYSPAFLHFGLTLFEAGSVEDAIKVLENGIAVCERKGEGHARDELIAALNQIRE